MLPCENQPYRSTNRILGFLGFLSPNALIITYGQTWPKYSLGNANSPKKISARSDHFWAKNMPQHAHRCSKNFLHFEFLFTYVRYWLIPIGYSVPLKMRRKKFSVKTGCHPNIIYLWVTRCHIFFFSHLSLIGAEWHPLVHTMEERDMSFYSAAR